MSITMKLNVMSSRFAHHVLYRMTRSQLPSNAFARLQEPIGLLLIGLPNWLESQSSQNKVSVCEWDAVCSVSVCKIVTQLEA